MPAIELNSERTGGHRPGPVVIDVLDANQVVVATVVYQMGTGSREIRVQEANEYKLRLYDPWGRDQILACRASDKSPLPVELDRSVSGRPRLSTSVSTPLPQNFWVRFWQQDRHNLWVENELPFNTEMRDNLCSLELTGELSGRVCIAFGGDRAPSKCAVLSGTTSGELQIGARQVKASSPWETHLTSTLFDDDPLVTSLRGYMRRGLQREASYIATEVMRSQQLVGSNALILTLLTILGGEEPLLDEFANRFRSLGENDSHELDEADRLPIAGWFLLQHEDPTDQTLEQAQSYFLTALSRGLPSDTAVMRLLVDGLTVFAAEKTASKSVVAARDLARDFARSMDWSSFHTQFRGLGPDEPSVDPEDLARKPESHYVSLLEKRRGWETDTLIGLGRRKTSVARVRIRKGSGRILVNKRPHDEYFRQIADLARLTEPLAKAGISDQIDILVRVRGGGTTGQSGAISLGIARALASGDQVLGRQLRHCGFLSRDSRKVERKHPGRRKARRGQQFSKR